MNLSKYYSSFRILDFMWSKHLNWWVSSRQDIMRVGPVLNGLLSLEVATISPCITLRHLTLRSWFLTWMSARLSTFSLAPVPSCYTYQHRNVRAISHNQKLQTYQHFRVGQSYPWEIAWTSPPFQQESNFQSNGMKDIYVTHKCLQKRTFSAFQNIIIHHGRDTDVFV